MRERERLGRMYGIRRGSDSNKRMVRRKKIKPACVREKQTRERGRNENNIYGTYNTVGGYTYVK